MGGSKLGSEEDCRGKITESEHGVGEGHWKEDDNKWEESDIVPLQETESECCFEIAKLDEWNW